MMSDMKIAIGLRSLETSDSGETKFSSFGVNSVHEYFVSVVVKKSTVFELS